MADQPTSLPQHQLVDIDILTDVGTCSVCGPDTRFYFKGGAYRCKNANREATKRWAAKKKAENQAAKAAALAALEGRDA